MTVSLRRPLIAGTVAAVSAGAVAVMPAGNPDRLAQALTLSGSDVSLAAWHNPINQLLGSLQVGQDYLFGAYYDSGVVNWPYAGFDQTGGELLNELLFTQPALGYYSYVGTLPDNTANAAPIQRQLQINWFDYINIGLSGLIGAGAAISTGVWDYPAALISAAELALQGDIAGAFTVLVDAVVVPATAVAESLVGAGVYIAENVLARLGAVLESLPQIITSFVGTAVGGATILATRSIDLATTWLGELASLNLEGAWNTAIDGLLGPSGLPGTVLNLLIGAGIQTGPITVPDDIPANFVPSLRTSVLGGIWTTADALATTPPASAEARSASPAAAEAVEVAAPRAAVAEAQGEAAESSAPETGATADVDAAAPSDVTASDTAAEAPAAGRGTETASGKDSASSSRAESGPRAKRAASAR